MHASLSSSGRAAQPLTHVAPLAAMEVLSHPEKRRQFDSVDEQVSDEFPSPTETTADNFYELWAPVFAREGRFSTKQPVPALGGPDSTKQEVESFYDFFYNIDSWRSFEYADKDVAEGADSCVPSLSLLPRPRRASSC